MTRISLRRVYDPPPANEEQPVLVDRLWPRGVSKERAELDLWDKEVAPSTALREWWNHDPDTYDEFVTRYEAELDASGAAQALMEKAAGEDVLTLLYAAHGVENNAAVLARYLRR